MKYSDSDRRRGLGRSRGCLNTKIHAAVDAKSHLVEIELSPGQDFDGPHRREIPAEFESDQIEHVLGDAAYDGDETLGVVKLLKAMACIKSSKTRKTRKHYDKQRYRDRNQAERFF